MNTKAVAVALMAVLLIAGGIYLLAGNEEQDIETGGSITTNDQITVSFNANGGNNAPKPQTALYNAIIGLPTNCTRSGHILTGWNTSADGSGTSWMPGDHYTVSDNITLYAQWTAQDKFFDPDAPKTATVNTTYEYTPGIDTSIFWSDAFRDGFNTNNEEGRRSWSALNKYPAYLSGLNETFSCTNVATGKEVSWLTYEIFNESSGGYTHTKGIKFTGTAPSTPGVYLVDFTAISKAMHYKWYITVGDQTSKEYTISFDANGGSQVPGSQSNICYNNLITLPGSGHSKLPTRANYTLVGWEGSNGTVYALGGLYPVTSDTTLKAKWSANANVIVFDTGGAYTSSGSTAFVTYTGSPVSMIDSSNITKTGYKLLGWYKSSLPSRVYNTDYTLESVTGYTVMCAYWVPNGTSTVKITFDANGADSASIVQEIEASKYAVTPVMGFNRSGYELKGWNTSESGGGTHYDLGKEIKVSSNTRLYAEWTSTGGSTNNYRVYFDPNGGNGGPSSQYVAYGDTAYEPSSKPVKPGMAFIGWSLTGENDSLFNFNNTPIHSTTTLKAVWLEQFTLSVSDRKVTVTISNEFREYISINKTVIDWGVSGLQNTEITTYAATSPDMEPGASGTITVTCTASGGKQYTSSKTFSIGTLEGSITIIFDAESTGGHGITALEYMPGSEMTLPKPGGSYYRDGYTLTGWALNQTQYKTHNVGDKYIVTEDATFFAVWTEGVITNSYTALAGIFAIIAGCCILGALKHGWLAVIALIAVILAAIFAHLGGILIW